MRRDGIHFCGFVYLDLTLAAYVGEDVTIRYDPRDLAEIRVYHERAFLCRAVCLKEIVRARNRRRRELRKGIGERTSLVDAILGLQRGPAPTSGAVEPPTNEKEAPARRLKLYRNE